MSNIYDGLGLEKYFENKGDLIDCPSETDIGMIVPISLHDLAKTISGGVVFKPPRIGRFNYFFTRDGFYNPANNSFRKQIIDRGTASARLHDKKGRDLSDLSFEVEAELDEGLNDTLKDVKGFYGFDASKDYIHSALGVKPESMGIFNSLLLNPDGSLLNIFSEASVPDNTRADDPLCLWNIYCANKDAPVARKFNEEIAQLGYSQDKVKSVLINASEARPIFIGIGRELQNSICSMLEESYELLEEAIVKDAVDSKRRFQLFEFKGSSLPYAESNLFSRDLIATIKTEGRHERDFLERMRRL